MSRRHCKPIKPLWPVQINYASPQAQGLVGWWPGNGAGGKLLDASGRGNHGVLTNFAAPFTSTSGWAPGVDGGSGALRLDGTDDYIAINKTFCSAPPVTYSFWAYIPSTSIHVCLIDDGLETGLGENSGIGVAIGSGNGDTNGNNLLVPFWGVDWQDTGIALGTGWVHIAVVLLSSLKMIAYKNGGASVFTGTSTMSNTVVSPGGLQIGRDTASSPRYFNGQIEDLRVYNQPLTRPVIAAIADRRTCWSLRWTPSRVAYSFGSGAAPPATSANAMFFGAI